MNKDNLEQLEQYLKNIKKPSISEGSYLNIKERVFTKIAVSENKEGVSLSSLIRHMRHLVANIDFPASQRALIKERVFVSLNTRAQRTFVWRNVFDFSKKFVSAGVLMFMVFGMFSFVGVNTQVVRAETFTVLDSFEGPIFVEREGKVIEAEAGMKLYEDDKVGTGDAGSAVIKYFDDSVSRLSSETELLVKRLLGQGGDNVDSMVEVSLLKGKVWSRVVNLVGDDAAFIVSAKDVSAKTKKAAFNVELKNDEVEVGVFNRSVEVERGGDKKVSKVVTGEKAVVNGDVKVEKIEKEERENEWVSANLEDDKEYVLEVKEKIVAAKLESLKAKSEKDVSLDESLKERLSVALTFDDVEKAKKEFEIVEKKFIGAQLRFEKEDLSEEEENEVLLVMDQYKEAVNNFYAFVDGVDLTDEEFAAELRSYVDNKILAHKKDLSVVSSESKLYAAKEFIDEISLSAIKDDAKYLEKKIDMLNDKIGEVEESVDRGIVEGAEGEIDDMKLMLEEMGVEDKEAKESLETGIEDLEQYLVAVNEGGQEEVQKPAILAEVAEEEIIEEEEEEMPELAEVPGEDKYGVKVYGDKVLPLELQ
ncbi:FecR domain-containing protein [Patescibacteria group bacterium]|nr:FecR domain-containing protein [Patescibacteria group bacterium]